MGKMELPTPPYSGLQPPNHHEKQRYKPSTPIKIPTRPRNILSPTFSPVHGPISPELIFDMSPVNCSASDYLLSPDQHSHFTSYTRYQSFNSKSPLGTSPHTPPFMYPFPRPSAHHRHTQSDHCAPLPSPQSGSSPLHSSSKVPSPRPSAHNTPLLLSPAFEDDDDYYFEDPLDYREYSFSTRGRSRVPRARRSSTSDRSHTLASSPSLSHRGRSPSATLVRPLSPPLTSSEEDDDDSDLEGVNKTAVETEAHINWFDVGFGKHLMKRSKYENTARVTKTRVVPPSLKVTVGS